MHWSDVKVLYAFSYAFRTFSIAVFSPSPGSSSYLRLTDLSRGGERVGVWDDLGFGMVEIS